MNDNRRGKLISIEGSEGAGKSTALSFIQSYLAERNHDIVMTREPGGTELAEQIRQLLLHPGSEKMTAHTELLLMFASRAQHIETFVRPALLAGKWIVSDRYIDASYAYQGGGRQIDNKEIQYLDDMIVQGTYPDLTIFMDIPVDQGLKRANERGAGKDRIEQEKIDFFERVRAAYQARAEQDPKRIKMIDASQSIENVQQQIKTVLDHFINQS